MLIFIYSLLFGCKPKCTNEAILNANKAHLSQIDFINEYCLDEEQESLLKRHQDSNVPLEHSLCTMDTTNLSPSNLLTVFDQCQGQVLTNRSTFATANGDPMLALVSYDLLQQKNIQTDLAQMYADSFLGDSLWPTTDENLDLPRIQTHQSFPSFMSEKHQHVAYLSTEKLYTKTDTLLTLSKGRLYDSDNSPKSSGLSPWSISNIKRHNAPTLFADKSTELYNIRRYATSLKEPTLSIPIYVVNDEDLIVDFLYFNIKLATNNTSPTNNNRNMIQVRFGNKGVDLIDASGQSLDTDSECHYSVCFSEPNDVLENRTIQSTITSWIEQQNTTSLQVDFPDDTTLQFIVETYAYLSKFGTIELLNEYAPCLTPPKNMVCVPGGTAVVGSNTDKNYEQPERKIIISTFYIDQYEITNSDYESCVQAGVCTKKVNTHKGFIQTFLDPNQPVVPMDWHMAHSYCAWRGKRLPTEWEWEKAARGPDGDLYPWGDSEPTCDKTVYRECHPKGCTPSPGFGNEWDCPNHKTRDVGTFPAGHYGIYEMAGNGYEWTDSWATTIEQCDNKCSGLDPKGPCDGAKTCYGYDRKVLRGGSWYWPANRLKGSHRRFEYPDSGGHRLSARCATSNPSIQ